MTDTRKPDGGGSFRVGGDDDADAGELTIVEMPTAAPLLNRGVPIADPQHPNNQPATPPPLPTAADNYFDQ